jgi:photosystem II stability/assembly factor-like uncharacterized protein
MLRLSVLSLLCLVVAATAYSQGYEETLRNDAGQYLPENPRGRYQFFRDRVVPPAKELPLGIQVQAYRQAMQDLDRLPFQKTSGAEDNDWVNRGPFNIGGRINCVAINPERPATMFIGAAAGGIWRSYDAAQSWHCISDALPTQSMGFIVINPLDTNIVYAGTGEVAFGSNTFDGAGIFKSSDAGSTWQQIGVGSIPPYARIAEMVINPVNPNIIYAAISSGVRSAAEMGIYRTVDAGATWQNIHSTRVTDIEIDPQNPNILYTVGTPVLGGVNVFFRGFHKSTDGGDSWEYKDMGVPTPAIGRTAISLCASQPNIIYAAVSEKAGSGRTNLIGVFKSIDAGETWAQLEVPFDYMVSQGWYDNVIAVHPTNPDIVIAGGVKLLRTSDGGASWERFRDQGAGGLLHVDQHAITFNPANPDEIFNGNDGGLYKISQNGTLVEKVDYGMSITQFIGGGLHPTNVDMLFGGTQDNGTLYSTSSRDFDQILYADGGYGAVNPDKPNIMWATQQYGRLFRSEDHGRTWYRINGDLPNDQSLFYMPFALDKKNPETLYYVTRSVYKTTNEGKNWERMKRNLFPATDGAVNLISAISIAPYDSDIILCGGSRGAGVAISFDAGDTWDIRSESLPVSNCSSVRSFKAGEIYATFSYFGVPSVWYSNDTAQTWTNISGNLPETTVSDVWKHGNDLFLATSIGVFLSEDNGGSWRLMQNGIPTVPAMRFYYHNNGYLRVFTHGRGIWDLQLEADPNTVPKFVSNPDTRTLQFGETFRYTPVVEANPPAKFLLIKSPSNTEFDSTLGAITWRGSDLLATFEIEAYNLAGKVTQEFTIYTGDVITADWDVISAEHMPTKVRHMEYIDNTLWVTRDSAGISRSTDGGFTWEHHQVMGSKPAIRGISALDANTAFVGARSGEVLKTTNGGASWTELFYNQGYKMSSMFFRDEMNGFFISSGFRDSSDVYHTSDGGTTWTRIPQRHYARIPEDYTLFSLDDDQLWYASTDGDDNYCRIHSTTDGGWTWTTSPIRVQSVSELVMFEPEFGLVLDNFTGDIWRTTTNSTWSNVKYPPEDRRNMSLDVDPQGKMLWAVSDTSAWVSRDRGENWTETRLVPVGPVQDAVFADSNRGWAISKNGIVQRLRANPIVSVTPLSAGSPGSFVLDRAYPNPATVSETVVIPFELKDAAFVSMSIYGSSGKKLEDLAARSFQSGRHSVEWNPGSVAPGVYFYTLKIGTHNASGRVSIIR